jgi:hypothetical protein
MCFKINSGKMKIFVMLICNVLAWVLNAQATIERQVFGTQGTCADSGQIKMDWTLGEPAISDMKTSFGTLTEGFQQGFKKSAVPGKIDYKNFEISIFPNPTNSGVTVELYQNPMEIIQWSLYDINGTLLQSNTYSWTRNLDIDLSSHPDGIYILQLYSDKSHKTRRIIKTTLF